MSPNIYFTFHAHFLIILSVKEEKNENLIYRITSLTLFNRTTFPQVLIENFFSKSLKFSDMNLQCRENKQI